MHTYKIKLNSIDKVQQFSSAISNYDGTAELNHNGYKINAKSILGIFCLDLNAVLDLMIDADSLPKELTHFLA